MRQTLLPLLLTLAGLTLSACASPGESTRMTVSDFQEMAAAMAQSLAADAQVRDRTPESEPWVVSMDKVTNLTSDVMTRAEQWSIMADLRSSLPLQHFRRTKAIRFVLPPERVQQLRRDQDLPELENVGRQRQPTHTLAATFRSLTRAGQEKRSDLYYAEFDLVDLDTGRTVWTDRFEYKRQAEGAIWD
ncbi:MAG: hypothetical protein ACLFVN_07035 [Phycisphaeraceae bacterium]